MDSSIVIERAWLSHAGRRINYIYEGVGQAAKFFLGRPLFYAEYEVDLSQVPESILLIPLVANLAPIAWFSGLPLEAPMLDAKFFTALGQVKAVFMNDYPEILENQSPILVESLIDNNISGSKHAMLFSGGVDAYATFFRHQEEGLDLISICGADIPIQDVTQWKRLVDLIDHEPLLETHSKQKIKANLRDFYTYHVSLLIPTRAWWGAVQHGLALNSLVAPLSTIRGYSRIYIASTHTEAIKIKWGSSPEIDNRIAWSNCSVHHDCYEFTRMDKIALIVSMSNRVSRGVCLRVCYSELSDGLNCSTCEKCLRTMFGLSLMGVDPSRYGFAPSRDAYSKILQIILKGFSTEGIRYLWWQFHQRMKVTPVSSIYLLGEEPAYNDVFKALAVQLDRPVSVKRLSTMKMAIIESFPRFFSLYLKIRRRLL